jgi:acetylornithine deacetylase/succinyl-diaminopimelate desuccinylase-like protein
MHPTTDRSWDTPAIRRAIRLLGAHAPRVRDARTTAQALRVVRDMIERRGVAVEVFQLPGMMPLLVAGTGPTAVVTFLDDPHPVAQQREDAPPQIEGDAVAGAGVIRKAGVLASLGALLGDPDGPSQYTLVVEGDRHAGSIALGAWLESSTRGLSAGLYETADLPVRVPAVSRSAAGLLTLDIAVRPTIDTVEASYAGVMPDTGHLLANAIAALKSPEGEVLASAFYDDVVTPSPAGMAILLQAAPEVARWVTGSAPPSDGGLTAEHLTLAMFLVPSLTVRSIRMDDAQPFVPREAHATIEIRVMPGQRVDQIQRSISELISERVPAATVSSVLTRTPATGWLVGDIQLPPALTELPLGIVGYPGGLMERVGIPALGFATVSRLSVAHDEHVTIGDIQHGTEVIEALARALAAIESASA